MSIPRWKSALAGFALLVIGVIIYLPSFNAPFTFDDQKAVVENQYIKITSLGPRALLGAALQDFHQNRPLTNLSFALNYYFNQVHPLGYHLVNFLVFMLTAFGVWMLLRRLLLRLGFERRSAELAACLSALVWTAYPLNIQSVTYVVQRHSCMAGMFSIWSLYFFHLGKEGAGKALRHYLLCALSCLAALLSKESAFTLPALLLAYKIYFFDDFKPGWFGKNWKWFAALAVFYLAGAALMLRPSLRPALYVFKGLDFTAYQRFLSEPKIICWYALLILFPLPQFLSVEHYFQPSHSLLDPKSTLIFFALVGLAVALAIVRARQNRLASFAVVWYFGQLLVEAMPIPIDLAAEQRLYLASLALIAPLVCGLALKTEKPKLALGFIVLISLFYAGFSFATEPGLGQSGTALAECGEKISPQFSRPANNYCALLAEAGNCEQAEKACRQAIAISPGFPEPYGNLRLCYSKKGREDLAEKALLAAAALGAEFRASPFTTSGLIHYNKHDYPESRSLV